MRSLILFNKLALATVALAVGMPLAAQSEDSAIFRPETMTDRPAGEPNEVMVLGTPHLSQLPDAFRPEMVEPLVARLVAWKPTAVATEDNSGVLCDFMRRYPTRYSVSVESYCFDPKEANEATGLDVAAANAAVETTLEDWPADPSPGMRRRLAALLLAAGEPSSALVQWLRLSDTERKADGVLTDALVAMLNKRMTRANESDLIAARIAAQSGLERVWSVDDQATYMGNLNDEEGYGAAISKAWDNPATKARIAQSDELAKGLGKRGAMLTYYRALNDPSYAEEAYRSDWGPALVEPSEEGFGRRYVAYWETRNLRMVANIREVLGRRPGTRMIAIVGASHKAYYEAYLRQMRDVDLVDVMPVLAP
ncbi:DUF5694 domain-containing protein [Qipengyuania sp.]|uniref:DUF5694 domain-containing protein n=1 Tax=Qipengyuania sp. TaxID=2004515 RepID=UPI0035C7D057